MQRISEEGADPAELVLGADISTAVWQGLREADSYVLFVGAFALAAHPQVRERLKAAYDRSDDEYLPVYEWLLDRYHRRMRPASPSRT